MRLQLANRASGISEKASEGRAHAGLRSRSFEQDAVGNLHLVKMIALGFKELPPLFDGRFHNRVVVSGERYVGAVRFEEVLVDMEAWAKRFERRFQPLDRILLLRAVQAFVVNARNTENHADISGLREEGRRIPKPVQVDVVVDGRPSFSRRDDPTE